MGMVEGKVAIVTGAAAGNGAGISRLLASEGATVNLWDIDTQVDKVAQKICETGGKAIAYKVDITDSDLVKKIADSVLNQFGKLDILVNNAAIYPLVMFRDTSTEIRDKCWEVNVKGTWNCTQAVLSSMIEQRSGKIVNISSVTGPLVSAPGYTAYAMTKGAISAMTRSLALEVAEFGIHVNAVLPGSIDTPGLRDIAIKRGKDPNKAKLEAGKTIPLGRQGTPEDVGGAVLFLASDYSNYITGSEIVVDGGNVIQELKTTR